MTKAERNRIQVLSETTSDVEHSPPPGQVAVVLTGLAIGILWFRHW
jgi:hypothetical protein